MFAEHVKSQLFYRPKFLLHRLLGGRCVEAVRPVALIQKPDLKIRFPVQRDPGRLVPVLRNADGSHGKITDHAVLVILFPGKICSERVEIGGLRRPGVHLRNMAEHIFHGKALLAEQHLPLLVADFHADRYMGVVADLYLKINPLVLQIRNDLYSGNVARGHRLHPDRLPDAGDCRVKDDLRIQRLFSSGLPLGIGGIRHRYHQFIVARLQRVGYIRRKRRVAAAMLCHFCAVYKHPGLPVHGAEMQKDPAALPLLRKRKSSAVPQFFLRLKGAFYPGQNRLDAEGHPDFSLRFGHCLRLPAADRVVPHTV